MNLTQAIERQLKTLVFAACNKDQQQYKIELKKLNTMDRDKEVPKSYLLALKIIATARSGDIESTKSQIKELNSIDNGLLSNFVIPNLKKCPESKSDDFINFVNKLESKAKLKNPLSNTSTFSFDSLKNSSAISIVAGLIILSALLIYRFNDKTVSNENNTMGMSLMREVVPMVLVRANINCGGETFWEAIGHGTGVVVNNRGLVLTNRHVVDLPEAKLAYYEQEWKSCGCNVIGYDIAVVFNIHGKDSSERRVLTSLSAQMSDYADLAWIETNLTTPEYLSFGTMPIEGDAVVCYGYPGSSAKLTSELTPSQNTPQVSQNTKATLREQINGILKLLEENSIQEVEAFALIAEAIVNAQRGPDAWLDEFGILNHVLELQDGTVNAITDTDQGVFIHHNCAANKGNSGGPLINNHGQVVGIITFGAPDDLTKQRALSSLSVFNELQYRSDLRFPY